MTEAIKDLPALAPAERAAVVLQSEKAAAGVVDGSEFARKTLRDEIMGDLYAMTINELEQVAHFIDRLQSLRKAA